MSIVLLRRAVELEPDVMDGKHTSILADDHDP